VSLGSFTLIDDYRYVAILYGDGGERGLLGLWFEGGWDSASRFLFVRK
jgi:hypothetical protein